MHRLGPCLRLFSYILLLHWFLIGGGPTSLSAQTIVPEETQLYRFGMHLFQLGDYYRAVTELKRFTLLFPQHQHYAEAQLLIGLALQEEAAYDDAWLHFQSLRQRTDERDALRVATFKLGEIRFLQRQYPQASIHFQQFLETFPDGPLVSSTLYMLGLSHALQGQSDYARRIWDALPADDMLTQRALALQEELQQAPVQPHKSPPLAGFLSGVLPGAGHLYVGKPGQALTAFLLNGLFLAGAAYAFHQGFEATGVILLYFETGWYLGTINSAVTAARDANRQQQQTLTDRLSTTYALPSLTLTQLQTPGLGLRLNF